MHTLLWTTAYIPFVHYCKSAWIKLYSTVRPAVLYLPHVQHQLRNQSLAARPSDAVTSYTTKHYGIHFTCKYIHRNVRTYFIHIVTLSVSAIQMCHFYIIFTITLDKYGPALIIFLLLSVQLYTDIIHNYMLFSF